MGGAQLAAMGRGDGGRARVLQADIPVARPYSLAVRSRMVDLQAQITQTQREVTPRLIGAQRGRRAALAGVCVVVAVIGVGGVVVVRRWLLAPFTALRRAAESVAAGEFGTRVPAVGPAELADLGRATERMRTRLVAALAEAERAEDSFRGLFESSPDALVTVAGDRSIVMVNAQAGRMFGYTKTELAGQPASILVPEAVRRANTDRDAGFYTNPAAWPVGENLQRTAVDKDGREFPIEASLSSLPAEARQGVSISIRGVSERAAAQAERERRRAEADRERFERRPPPCPPLGSPRRRGGRLPPHLNKPLNTLRRAPQGQRRPRRH